MDAGGKLVQSAGAPLGHGACESAAGNNADAPTDSELVSKPSTEEPSGGARSARGGITEQEASSVCAADSKAKSESNEGTLSQGLPSLDSLESFSNLNSSCPSSEPVSEALEDQDKALVPQGQPGAEGGKAQSCRERGGAGQSIYHIKWIRWKEENTPIITQNENGPCPLLAIMNVLLLAWKVNNNKNNNNNSNKHEEFLASVPK
ncbi:ubiquitin carboxyl-terminal hydrolase MINDY-2 isoform X2, partial [Clarias magur]